MKASHLYRAGVKILESAKSFQGAAQQMVTGGTRQLTTAETEAFENYKLFDVGFFLVALAIENLVKGIWAGRHYSELQQVTSTRKDLPRLTDHKLANVARDAGVTLSNSEESLLDALSEIIIWYGRYPIPVRLDTYRQILSAGPPSNRFLSGADVTTMELPLPAEIERLVEKLLVELESIPEANRC
jgi:hypothetical protein